MSFAFEGFYQNQLQPLVFLPVVLKKAWSSSTGNDLLFTDLKHCFRLNNIIIIIRRKLSASYTTVPYVNTPRKSFQKNRWHFRRTMEGPLKGPVHKLHAHISVISGPHQAYVSVPGAQGL